MTCYCKTPLVYDPDRAYWSRVRSAFRGLLAVAVLLLTALDEVATALLGLPALTPRLRRWWGAIADEYRAGAMGVFDAEVIEDENEEVL
ncbi:hypothetical protein [Actinomadura sp. GTD37]|uniref:hypothetical protein n=1 Tax=Actinomadura sp. GTD37 TaxID=1778030 RepID=UPI0035BFCE86